MPRTVYLRRRPVTLYEVMVEVWGKARRGQRLALLVCKFELLNRGILPLAGVLITRSIYLYLG